LYCINFLNNSTAKDDIAATPSPLSAIAKTLACAGVTRQPLHMPTTHNLKKQHTHTIPKKVDKQKQTAASWRMVLLQSNIQRGFDNFSGRRERGEL